jgi:hypothetical protein
MMEDVKKNTVMECARKYGFNLEEALSGIGIVNIEKKKKENKKVEKVEKVRTPLPFTGRVMEGKCHGLKQNHGLLTQCTNESKDEYCRGCKKQCEKNASGKPDSGCIEDRMIAFNSGIEYRDPKGRSPIAYAKIMQKLNLTREMVEAAAAKQNVILSESDFVMPESKRGRPKKANDTGSETSSEPKKRGRPKKIEKPVEVSSTEDLFASLISEMKTTPKAEEKPKSTKESTKLAKEAEKQAAKLAKEAEKQAAKLAKEAEKQAAKAKKESEKKREVTGVARAPWHALVQSSHTDNYNHMQTSVKHYKYQPISAYWQYCCCILHVAYLEFAYRPEKRLDRGLEPLVGP